MLELQKQKYIEVNKIAKNFINDIENTNTT